MGAPASAEISALTSMGPVHLTVSDLERSLAFYRDVLGLVLLGREDGRASVGAGRARAARARRGARARPAFGSHGPLPLRPAPPERADLAAWLAHVARERVPLAGLSDHFVSEAIYLSDPDGHGIEVYWDRPREVWEGQVGADDDHPARHPQPPRRARGPGDRPLRRAPGRHGDGARAPEGRRDRGHGGLLPRRARLRPHGAARRAGRVPRRRAATTTTSARTRGRARARRRLPQAPLRSARATIVLPDAAERDAWSTGSSARGTKAEPGTTARSPSTRPGTRSSSLSPEPMP